MIRRQQIERALAKALRDRGYHIVDDSGGDLYAVMRGNCVLAQAGEPCSRRGEAKISLTELAQEIESEIAS